MNLNQEQIKAIGFLFLMMVIVVPLAFYGFRKLRMYETTKILVQLQEMQDLTGNNYDEDSSDESKKRKLILFLVSGTIYKVSKIKSRMYIYPTLAILISIGTSVYVTQNPLGSNNATVLLITSLLVVACAGTYLYKKKEIADYRVFIDSFAEAHGIKGELTQERLSTIKEILPPQSMQNNT